MGWTYSCGENETMNLILLCNISDGDWLAFAGALAGALATIIAVILTICSGKRADKKNRILAAKPWINADAKPLNEVIEIDALMSGKPEFVFLYNGEWLSSYKKPALLEKLRYNQDYCIVQYTIKNVGGNTATFVDFTINDSKIRPLFALPLNTDMVFILCLPKDDENSKKQYELKFVYGDVVSNKKYVQNGFLTIEKQDTGIKLTHGPALLFAPEELKDLKNISNA